MRRKLLFGFVILTFLVGCATLGLKPWTDFTPKQKAIYFQNCYLSAAKNADATLKNPEAKEAAKKLALQDKAVLTQLYPLIKAYRSTVDGGGFPAPGDEEIILNLLDKLINLL